MVWLKPLAQRLDVSYAKESMQPAQVQIQHKITAAHIRVPYEITTLVTTAVITLFLGFLLSVYIDPFAVVILFVILLFFIIVQQGIFLGNAVKISDKQFPQIHELVLQAVEKLNVKVAPQVYIMQDPTLNAFTLGYGRWHTIVLHSALVETMTQDELLFIIAHEMGHIKASHVLLSSLIMPFGSFLPFAQYIFGIWWRKAELTADRAGAIVVPNVSIGISSFAKLAIGKALFEKLDTSTFLAQGKDVDARFADRAGQLLMDHPYLTNRVKNLLAFVKSARYHELTAESFSYRYCQNCGARNTTTAKFCSSCGQQVV